MMKKNLQKTPAQASSQKSSMTQMNKDKENSPILREALLCHGHHNEREKNMQSKTTISEDQNLSIPSKSTTSNGSSSLEDLDLDMDLIIDDSPCEEDNDGFVIDEKLDLDLDMETSAQACHQLLEIKLCLKLLL